MVLSASHLLSLPNAFPLPFCSFPALAHANFIFHSQHWLHCTYDSKSKILAPHSHLSNNSSSSFTPYTLFRTPNQLLSFAPSHESLNFHRCMNACYFLHPWSHFFHSHLHRVITSVRPFKHSPTNCIKKAVYPFKTKLGDLIHARHCLLGCNIHSPAQLMRALKQGLWFPVLWGTDHTVRT